MAIAPRCLVSAFHFTDGHKVSILKIVYVHERELQWGCERCGARQFRGCPLGLGWEQGGGGGKCPGRRR